MSQFLEINSIIAGASLVYLWYYLSSLLVVVFSNLVNETKQNTTEWSFIYNFKLVVDQRFVVMKYFRIIRPQTAEMFLMCQNK